MSFQILNVNKLPVPINELDKEAAELWQTPVDKESYASPQPIPQMENYKESLEYWRQRENWFDKIGWKIHKGTTSWELLRAEILAPFTKYPIDVVMNEPAIGGFIKLIDLWESKGYIPVQINE